MTLQVDLVSPERQVFSAEADMVIARTVDGDIAFQTGHVPLIGVLETNRLKVLLSDGTEQLIAVHRGFVEVSHNHVTVLSDVAELAEDVDVARARAALDRAEAALAADGDDEAAIAAKQRAETRLWVVGELTGAG